LQKHRASIAAQEVIKAELHGEGIRNLNTSQVETTSIGPRFV